MHRITGKLCSQYRNVKGLIGEGQKNLQPDFSWGIYIAVEIQPNSLNSTVLPVATTNLLLAVFSPPHNDLLVPDRNTVQQKCKLRGAWLVLLKLFPELNTGVDRYWLIFLMKVCKKAS